MRGPDEADGSSTRPKTSPPAPPPRSRSLAQGAAINPERLRQARQLAERAIKDKKIFAVLGPYPVIRACLRRRGWVEMRLWAPAEGATPRSGASRRSRANVRRRRRNDGGSGGDDDDDDDDDDVGDDDGDDDGGDESGDVVDDEDDETGKENCEQHGVSHELLSRLVRNEVPYLIWTTRCGSVDTKLLRKEQMLNHFARAGSFTTKVGLCVNMRNLPWFDSANPDVFFPRCYRLGAVEDKIAFIEDFRLTAATSLLKLVVERHGAMDGVGALEGTEAQRGGPGVEAPQRDRWLLDRAMAACETFLRSQEHEDIDGTASRPESPDWDAFLQRYYRLVHGGERLRGVAGLAPQCRDLLSRLRTARPQLDMEGTRNTWVVKPGAMSRGRGVLCMNRLCEMLRLVECDATLVKDGRWIVQKYVERPLLIHATKFDIRQWFLVTDWNPLTVWFYEDCYLRFSTQPFQLDDLDTSIHLCNNSIQKHFENAQGRSSQLPRDNIWHGRQFVSYLESLGLGFAWEGVVVPGMKQAIIHALQAAQDVVDPRRGSFELYGADFLLGEDQRPWLLEINSSPTMSPSTPVTAELCARVQDDLLRVVLDRRIDRAAHTGGFHLIYKQPAVEVPQYLGVNLSVEGEGVKRSRASQPRIGVPMCTGAPPDRAPPHTAHPQQPASPPTPPIRPLHGVHLAHGARTAGPHYHHQQHHHQHHHHNPTLSVKSPSGRRRAGDAPRFLRRSHSLVAPVKRQQRRSHSRSPESDATIARRAAQRFAHRAEQRAARLDTRGEGEVPAAPVGATREVVACTVVVASELPQAGGMPAGGHVAATVTASVGKGDDDGDDGGTARVCAASGEARSDAESRGAADHHRSHCAGLWRRDTALAQEGDAEPGAAARDSRRTLSPSPLALNPASRPAVAPGRRAPPCPSLAPTPRPLTLRLWRRAQQGASWREVQDSSSVWRDVSFPPLRAPRPPSGMCPPLRCALPPVVLQGIVRLSGAAVQGSLPPPSLRANRRAFY
ncbi:tubulin monoglycylase TTLL3 [Lethenteron reissneri]|uniref:tubulin monoglycylase TTLL3 n=1 Tax=Lethenteron reissneri TaxID=7753 RepID=UPI002AB718A5|nr:tubulin monoglycylase TTLL3 [Lethenteron reissneri]